MTSPSQPEPKPRRRQTRHVYRRVMRGQGNTGRGETYPFDMWFDGEWHTAHPGDYQSTQPTMKSALYAWAKRWDTEVQVQMNDDDSLTFRYLRPMPRVLAERRHKKYSPIMLPPGEEVSPPTP